MGTNQKKILNNINFKNILTNGLIMSSSENIQLLQEGKYD